MTNIPETYQLGFNLYQKFLNKVDEMYLKAGGKINMTKEEVISDLIDYLISLSFVVSFADKYLRDSEITFINTIFNKNYNDDIELKDHQKRIEDIPAVVKLSVLTDKAFDEELVVNKPTYCQQTYDFLLRFPTYLKFSDGNVPPSEDIMLKKSLENVVSYYKKNYVRYARQRKED